MPEIFINDEENLESHKESMVSLGKSIDASINRLRNNYSRMNLDGEAIHENQSEYSVTQLEKCIQD
jgi:hypothetical protein